MTEKSPNDPLAPLIQMTNVVRQIETAKQTRRLLDDVSWVLSPGARVAILAVNKAESYAFVACACGVQAIQSGRVDIKAHVSWPLGEAGAISGRLTPRQNADFLQKIYGPRKNSREQIDAIKEMSDLPVGFFDRPLRDLNSTMKSRYKLAISLVFDFDVYVVPKLDAWPYKSTTSRTQRFREAFERLILKKSLLVSNPDPAFQKAYCQHGIVLDDGKIVYQDDLEPCQEWLAYRLKKRP